MTCSSVPFRSASVMSAVDGEALELVEDREVRRRDLVAPVDAADRDHVDRRRLRLHGVDLRRRRLGAQQPVGVEEERVARRAGRVRRREGELVEVVVRLSRPRGRRRSRSRGRGTRPRRARRMWVVGWSDPSGRSSPGSVTSTAPRRSRRRARRARAPRRRASTASSSRSRTAFSAMPVSRSRTSRSACFSSLLRPR